VEVDVEAGVEVAAGEDELLEILAGEEEGSEEEPEESEFDPPVAASTEPDEEDVPAG